MTKCVSEAPRYKHIMQLEAMYRLCAQRGPHLISLAHAEFIDTMLQVQAVLNPSVCAIQPVQPTNDAERICREKTRL